MSTTTTTTTTTQKPKAVTLAAITKAKGDPSALAALAAGLSVERDALARRTIDTTKEHYRLLGAIADATTRASSTYDSNATSLTSTDFCKAVGITAEDSWQGWSVPTVKMALIVHRCHTEAAYEIWTNLSCAFEKNEDGSGRIGDADVHPARVSLFSRHAVAYANWVNLFDQKVAHADGRFTEKPATITAREKATRERAEAVQAEKRGEKLSASYVSLVSAGTDTVAFGSITWSALHALSADDVIVAADVLTALAAALNAGTYKVAPAADAETGASEKPKATRKPKKK